MANKSIPSLSTVGWTKDYNEIIQKLYVYFIVSEYSQSNSYYGEIASLKYILQSHSDIEDIKLAIQKVLLNMYDRYFDSVDITVDIIETDTSVSYSVNIIAIASDGITYKLNKTIQTDANRTIINLDKNIAGLYEV